tara:strand:+ start:706 stop:936 length:231 start_codon:yes stop_codon:yes gene_type:complete
MEILLNRLKPFYIAKLEEVKDEHPYTYKVIIRDLTNQYIYGDLTVSSAMTLCTFLTNNSVDLYSLNSEIFNPLKIK